MIKRLRIQNYLSLKDIDLELGLRNILIGPNMAGKSNIIDACRFLTNIAISGLTAAVNDRGGFSEILWKGTDDGNIIFSATIEIDSEKGSSTTYEYNIILNGSTKTGQGTYDIAKESLNRVNENGERPLAEFRNGRGKGFHQDGSIAFEEKESSQRSFLEYSVPGWEGMVAKQIISRWRYYRLLPFAMRQANTISEQLFLKENGDNLSAWLLTLQTRYRDDYTRLEQAVKDTLPDIMSVLTPPTQVGTTFVLLKEKFLKRPTNLWQVSDGTLQFLALLSLIFAPTELGAPLFCVEEPENHLHPKLMECLIELLNQRQQELGPKAAQVMIATHYPYLIDIVSLDELLAVVKRDGATQCLRPKEKKYLHDLLEQGELSLSDLWYSGALGEK